MRRLVTLAIILVIASPSVASGSTTPGGFVATDSLHAARQDMASATLDNGNVLMLGGQFPPSARADVYNTSSGRFVAASSMSTARYGAGAARLGDGRVLVAGGYGANLQVTASAEIYSTTSGSFTAAGLLATARGNPMVIALPDGRVLVAGGSTLAGATNTGEVYDALTNSFTPTNSTMSSARTDAVAVRLDSGKILIAGGQDASGGYLSSAEIYDQSTREFSATGSMAHGRAFATAVKLLNGDVLIAGGSDGNALDSIEIYQPASGSFIALGSALSEPRRSPLAAILGDGRVLVAGGFSNAQPLQSADVFNPDNGAIYATGAMASPHGAGTVAALSTGMALVAGGSTGTGATAAAELFDAARTEVPAVPCPSAAAPPSGSVGISINDGAVFTRTPQVQLDLVWPACTTSIQISNDGGFKSPTTVAAQASVVWTLVSTGPERLPKTVYIRFGTSTQNYTDDIILDETPPTLTSITIRTDNVVGKTRNAHPRALKRRTAWVITKASDRVSGVRKIQLATQRRKPGPAVTYKARIKTTVAKSLVWARVQDGAGNFSAWKSARVP